MQRRHLLIGTVATAATCFAQLAATQSPWPSKIIRFIVPLPPGGAYDYLARSLSPPLSTVLNQSIIVENRVGADGRIGTEYVARQPADGYTFGIIANTSVIHPSLFKEMQYDIFRDFQPVGLIASLPFVLVVNPAVPVTSAKEYLALVRSKPGYVTFGSSGVGSPYQLLGELMKSVAKVDMLHVPYRGTAPLMQALLGGDVMSAFAPIGPVLKYIEAGKLRPLGLAGTTDSRVLPQLKSIAKDLNMPSLASDPWLGVVAPKGTPRNIVDRVSTEISRIVNEPSFAKEKLELQGYEPIGSTPEKMASVMKSDFDLYARIVRDARIPAE